VNRKAKDVKVEDDGGAGRAKKLKMDQEKHSYPSLTMPEVEDDIANERNVALLKQESAKPSLMVTIEQLCLEQVTNKMT